MQKPNKSLPGTTRGLQNPCRKHQERSRTSWNNFFNSFEHLSNHCTRKATSEPKGTSPSPRATRTIHSFNPSLRITHAGAVEISRLDSPPNLRYISEDPAKRWSRARGRQGPGVRPPRGPPELQNPFFWTSCALLRPQEGSREVHIHISSVPDTPIPEKP